MPWLRLPQCAGLAAILLLTSWGALVGCAKRDPLDERVDAKTMNKFVRWQKRHVQPLGNPIVSEFGQAITLIAQKTPGYKAPHTREEFNSPFNPLCRRIHGRPLRRVIIEGYEISTAHLRDRVFLRRTNAGNVQIGANEQGVDATRYVASVEAELQRLEDLIRFQEARIRELRGTGS